MDNTYTSNELIHLVGRNHPFDDNLNFDILSKVIKDGCVSHPPHDPNWTGVSLVIKLNESLLSEDLIVPNVTCYADIPLQCLEIHINKYGKFGLSFPRDLIIRYGARPVMYIPTRSDDWGSINGKTLIKDIEAVYKGFCKYVAKDVDGGKTESRSLGKVPSCIDEAISATENVLMKDFLAFIKPFNSELSEKDEHNYYMEREWRKYGNLKFNAKDLVRIFVAKGYKRKLARDFPIYENIIVEI